MPTQTRRAIVYSVVLWLLGFVWGSLVFMSPGLKATPPMPPISSNPWISFPILLAWLPLSYLLARRHLREAAVPGPEGVQLGLFFCVINFSLDLVVLVVAFDVGFRYFASLSVLVGYVVLFVVPVLVGRRAQAQRSGRA